MFIYIPLLCGQVLINPLVHRFCESAKYGPYLALKKQHESCWCRAHKVNAAVHMLHDNKQQLRTCLSVLWALCFGLKPGAETYHGAFCRLKMRLRLRYETEHTLLSGTGAAPSSLNDAFLCICIKRVYQSCWLPNYNAMSYNNFSTTVREKHSVVVGGFAEMAG